MRSFDELELAAVFVTHAVSIFIRVRDRRKALDQVNEGFKTPPDTKSPCHQNGLRVMTPQISY
jgi:hypothetical protein